MATLPKILVAVDGSDQSRHTITYLSRILSSKDVGLELFHVLTEAPEPFFDESATAATAAYETEIATWKASRGTQISRFMDDAQKSFLDAGFPSGSVSVSVQPRKIGIARDIISKSKRGYAAVVIGRNGFGTLPEFMIGSIASKLADAVAHIPLAIVGGQPETRKVIVAYDQSWRVRKGMDKVSVLFSRSLEDILFCHIVRPLSEHHPTRQSFFTSRNEAHWLDENSRQIVPAMVTAKKHLNHAGFEPKAFRTAILKEKTSRANGVCMEADTLGAGTIIVGRRGATVVEDFAMGRVTRKILYLAFNKAIWIV
jgi:nucleotide-binding universal stress UspA family protein